MFYVTSSLTVLQAFLGLALVCVSIYALTRSEDFRQLKYVAVGRMFTVKSIHGALVLGGVGALLLGFAVLAVSYLR
jgi:hypothetical protein